jgi:hypothetical protein
MIQCSISAPLPYSSGTGVEVDGTSVIPQTGQMPGVSCCTSGWSGQV